MRVSRCFSGALLLVGLVAISAIGGTGRPTLRDQLAAVPWTSDNLSKLKGLLPDRNAAADFVAGFYREATSAGMEPHVGDYGFVSLSGERTLTFLASIDWSGRAFYTSIAVVRNRNGKLRMQEIRTGGGASADRLMDRIVDLHHDGQTEILVPRLLGRYAGATPVGVVDDVYAWNGSEFVKDDGAFRDYYAKTVLPRLQAALASLVRNAGATGSGDDSRASEKGKKEAARRHQQIVEKYRREIAEVKRIISE